MNVATLAYPDAESTEDTQAASSTEAIPTIVERVCRRVAPLWPLKNFVAVNPFVGFSNERFDAACGLFRQLAGIELLMPRSFYRQALASGRIVAEDLQSALKDSAVRDRTSIDLEDLKRTLESERPAPSPSDRVATVSDILDEISGGDRQTSRTAFMIDEIGRAHV